MAGGTLHDGPARPESVADRNMDTQMNTNKQDYKVADLSLADWGRKEIALAEKEMPGLMALRAKYGASKLGLCQNELRLPMIPATEAAQAKMDAAIAHAGLLDGNAGAAKAHG